MKNLKTLYRAAGLTQFSLARKARVPKWKIGDVASGRATFTREERSRVLEVLAVAIPKNSAQVLAMLEREGEARTSDT